MEFVPKRQASLLVRNRTSTLALLAVAYLGRRGLHVLMRWKRKERGWDQFQRLRRSLSKGSFGMKDDNRDWREPWTQHSLDRKRRGDPFNERNRFGVSTAGSWPTHHIHILGFIYCPPWQALERRLSSQRPLWAYFASIHASASSTTVFHVT